MDTVVLEDIGLTNAEIKVYLALLRLGPSKAGPIKEKTNLQNSVVYMAIGKLAEKGLISCVKEGKISIYNASNPQHISDYIEEKKERFEEIIPELLAARDSAKEKPEVLLFRGKRGMRELLQEVLASGGKEYLVMGAPDSSMAMGEAFWRGHHKKRVAKGIYAKLIFNHSLRKWNKDRNMHYKKEELRFTRENFEPLTHTLICGNVLALILWTEKPIGILVTNSIIAQSYSKFFGILWQHAKP